MKTNLIIALLFVSSTLMAQNSEGKFKISKNQWALGGTISFSHQNSENSASNNNWENKSNVFNFRPDIGYVISDNLVIGIELGYGYGSSKNTDQIVFEQKSNSYNITPYIRKYFAITEKLAFNLQGEVSYGKQKRNYTQPNNLNDYDGESYFIGLRPGITYSFSNKIYLKADLGSLGYSKSNNKNNAQETYKSDSFGFNLSTSDLYFGMLFIL